MYCKNCGAQLDNNNVCNNCEKSIVGVQNQQIKEKSKEKKVLVDSNCFICKWNLIEDFCFSSKSHIIRK